MQKDRLYFHHQLQLPMAYGLSKNLDRRHTMSIRITCMIQQSFKRLVILPAAIAALSLGASCANYNSAAKNDAATGALLGGAAGAIIGNQSGNTGKGAAIGAGAGAVVGYMFGN